MLNGTLQEFYKATVQTAGLGDKSVLHAFCRDVWNEHNAAVKSAAAMAEKQCDAVDLDLAKQLATDSDFAKGWLVQQLAAAALSGNTAAAAKELRDLLGIGSVESELKIELIDYKSMCDDCPKLQPPAPINLKEVEQ